jgi:periplasmic copper chaperone A
MIRRLAVVGAIVIGVVGLMAGPAFAHVEIERDGDVGADGVVATTLHVPNEETTAGTTKVVLVFPANPKLTTANPGAVGGWTPTVEKDANGAVTQITWTGGPLTGDQKVAFPLSLGPIAEGVNTVDFKALQTYDDGTVVRWIEATPASGEEPEHPAPVLTARGKQPVDDDEAATSTDHATTDTHASDTTKSDDGMSTGVIIAIVVGIIIVLALLGFLLSRSRRNMGSSSD